MTFGVVRQDTDHNTQPAPESANSMLVPLYVKLWFEVDFLLFIRKIVNPIFDLWRWKPCVYSQKLPNQSDILIHTHCIALHAYLMYVAFLLWFQCYVVWYTNLKTCIKFLMSSFWHQQNITSSFCVGKKHPSPLVG